MSDRCSMTRRSMLGASVATLASKATDVFADSTRRNCVVHGRVFNASTQTQRGLDGILVSNGVEVVRTTNDGFYSLPARQDVFIIKPSHWSVPVDHLTGLPDFAGNRHILRCLQTAGAVGLENIDAPRTIDFNLRYCPEPKRFTAALFADPQPADKNELVYLSRAMDKMSARKDFAFGLALGDIASDNLTIFPDYLAQSARLGVPVWHIPGNHDHDVGGGAQKDRLQTWRSTFGPPSYAFEYSGALFIMLDNVSVRSDGSYFGEIGINGLTFVRNLLSLTHPEKLVVVCTHIPLTSSHHDDPSCTTSDTNTLLQLLSRRRAVSFAGHMHTSEHHYIPNAESAHHHQVITALSGSWWSGPMDQQGLPLSIASDGTPHGWHALSIDGQDYHTEFVPARHDAIGRLIANFAASGSPDAVHLEIVNGFAEHPVLVNVFDGGPRTRVYMDIGSERHTLRRASAIDPYTASLFSEAGDSIKYWVQPEACSHLWTLDTGGRLPVDLTGARLSIHDEFGRPRLDRVGLFAA